MFSLSTRFNVILYNMMAGMCAMGLLNYLDGYFSTHELKDLQFEMTKLDMFINDKYINEHAASFQFNLKADIADLFNWNTNIIFLSIYCDYETEPGLRN